MTKKQKPSVPDEPADRAGMELLASHVPLSLLIDLAEDRGPHSDEIMLEEHPSDAELSWIAAG